MTTVVVDVKNKAVYADSRGTTTYKRLEFIDRFPFVAFKEEYEYTSVDKIYRVNGVVVSMSGSLDVLLQFLQDYKSRLGDVPRGIKLSCDYPGETSIVVVGADFVKKYKFKKHFKLLSLSYGVKLYETTSHEDDNFVITGSGGNYATGALAMEATPTEAIGVASKYDDFTDNNVKCMEVL